MILSTIGNLQGLFYDGVVIGRGIHQPWIFYLFSTVFTRNFCFTFFIYFKLSRIFINVKQKKKLLKDDDLKLLFCEIDDVVFKLHYGFTTYLLLFMTFLSVSKVFFNEPIYCSLGHYEYEKVISKEMLNNYCYIRSTFIVPNSANYLDDSTYEYPGVGPYRGVVNLFKK